MHSEEILGGCLCQKYPKIQYYQFDKLTFVIHTSEMSHCAFRKERMKQGLYQRGSGGYSAATGGVLEISAPAYKYLKPPPKKMFPLRKVHRFINDLY